jgi:hypothetical protein
VGQIFWSRNHPDGGERPWLTRRGWRALDYLLIEEAQHSLLELTAPLAGMISTSGASWRRSGDCVVAIGLPTDMSTRPGGSAA